MKIRKKILYFLAICMLIFSVYKIIDTYAIFYTEKASELSLPIGKWHIALNGTDITSGITQEMIVDSFYVNPSEYTVENKIAPGMQGFFEIEISPQDTQVSIRYDITIESSELEGNQIKFLEIEETKNSNTIVRTGENTYTGIILLEDISEDYSDIIKVGFSWENDENNNEEDTEIGTVYNSAVAIPIKINAIQYLGETLEEYEESEQI